MLRLGIVGLPNVGKSTLFNALTSAGVLAANYPFATKEPNVGRVNVPDERLDVLARIVHPERVTPAVVEFLDIAGLVKGASQGEGLGNQFLANIRETDAIVHVVRAFDDDDVLHVMGTVDPARDREVIEFELALADLSVVEKRLDRVKRASKTGDKEALAELGALERANAALSEGKPLWHIDLTADERTTLAPLALLTVKPILYAANGGGERRGRRGRGLLRQDRSRAGRIARRRSRRVSRIARHCIGGARPAHPRRLPLARLADLLHRRRAGSPRLDHPSG
jgi:hypothetical protein